MKGKYPTPAHSSHPVPNAGRGIGGREGGRGRFRETCKVHRGTDSPKLRLDQTQQGCEDY